MHCQSCGYRGKGSKPAQLNVVVGKQTASKPQTKLYAPAAANTAHVSSHGPTYLRGDITVVGPDGARTKRTRMALCRCGATKNPPYCDNSHHAAKFIDVGAVGETGEPLTATGGELVVSPCLDGPNEVTGNLTVHAGTGREAYHATQCWLCRCGQSKNKPFCDGSHRAAGFTAPGS